MKNIIWSKDNCSYCTKAKMLLQSRNISFEERNISKDWTKEQLLEAVPDAKTVPQIFLWGKYVGGYDSLLIYIENHNMYSNG
jgi:glutaredoxin-related protein